MAAVDGEPAEDRIFTRHTELSGRMKLRLWVQTTATTGGAGPELLTDGPSAAPEGTLGGDWRESAVYDGPSPPTRPSQNERIPRERGGFGSTAEGGDSNSRYANKTHNGFRDRRIQPLCHPSWGTSEG